jgi:hypothetical protein
LKQVLGIEDVDDNEQINKFLEDVLAQEDDDDDETNAGEDNDDRFEALVDKLETIHQNLIEKTMKLQVKTESMT